MSLTLLKRDGTTRSVGSRCACGEPAVVRLEREQDAVNRLRVGFEKRRCAQFPVQEITQSATS